jgi:hypothetical protein
MNTDDIANALAAVDLLPQLKGKMIKRELTLADRSTLVVRVSRSPSDKNRNRTGFSK